MKLTFDIPEGTNGNFSIEKRTTDFLAGRSVPQDTYTVLVDDAIDNIMQDTPDEYNEHQPLWDNATGDVLIGGLGIGFIIQKLMDNSNVNTVTIVEKHQEVIDLVWSSCPKDDTIILVHDDIETWNPTQTFDCGWFDTWTTKHPSMTKEEYDEFIIGKYTPHCNWIGVWEQLG